MTDTAHIAKTFEILLRHEPEWERGFLQHILMGALNTPGIGTNPLLPQALFLLPTHLRKASYPASEEVRGLVVLLVLVAEQDPRFLHNFMDGLPCSPFL